MQPMEVRGCPFNLIPKGSVKNWMVYLKYWWSLLDRRSPPFYGSVSGVTDKKVEDLFTNLFKLLKMLCLIIINAEIAAAVQSMFPDFTFGGGRKILGIECILQAASHLKFQAGRKLRKFFAIVHYVLYTNQDIFDPTRLEYVLACFCGFTIVTEGVADGEEDFSGMNGTLRFHCIKWMNEQRKRVRDRLAPDYRKCPCNRTFPPEKGGTRNGRLPRILYYRDSTLDEDGFSGGKVAIYEGYDPTKWEDTVEVYDHRPAMVQRPTINRALMPALRVPQSPASNVARGNRAALPAPRIPDQLRIPSEDDLDSSSSGGSRLKPRQASSSRRTLEEMLMVRVQRGETLTAENLAVLLAKYKKVRYAFKLPDVIPPFQL